MLLTDAKSEATTWVTLRNFVLSKKPERGTVHTEQIHLYEVLKGAKLICV